jgi:hypothetical protein
MRPFEEGIEAFKEGRLGNPYRQGTRDYTEWEQGFNKAYFRNLERVRNREQAEGRHREVQGGVKEKANTSSSSNSQPAFT